MEHLLARYREIRPLFFVAARPMKVEWKIKPYFGVLVRVFNALHTTKQTDTIWHLLDNDGGLKKNSLKEARCTCNKTKIGKKRTKSETYTWIILETNNCCSCKLEAFLQRITMYSKTSSRHIHVIIFCTANTKYFANNQHTSYSVLILTLTYSANLADYLVLSHGNFYAKEQHSKHLWHMAPVCYNQYYF